jgi:hypothetical protein
LAAWEVLGLRTSNPRAVRLGEEIYGAGDYRSEQLYIYIDPYIYIYIYRDALFDTQGAE